MGMVIRVFPYFLPNFIHAGKAFHFLFSGIRFLCFKNSHVGGHA